VYTIWSGSVGDPVWIRPNWPLHEVRGLFSFRRGGVSLPPYEELNVGLHVGDDADAVLKNRERCAIEVGCPVERWVVAEQVHGAKVAVITEAEAGCGARDVHSAIQGADALVTDVSGLGLVVMAADCVPVLFYDGVRQVIGAAHSGWKGTVQHIVRRVLETMQQAFQSNPADVQVWIGPSIRQCCYEVNDVVADPIKAEFGRRVLVKRFHRAERYLLSLQACVRQDLLRSGVRPEHIVDTGVCTSCQADVLFSHRADAGRTGRQLAMVCLVEDEV
jgi:polyphenol oxidase